MRKSKHKKASPIDISDLRLGDEYNQINPDLRGSCNIYLSINLVELLHRLTPRGWERARQWVYGFRFTVLLLLRNKNPPSYKYRFNFLLMKCLISFTVLNLIKLKLELSYQQILFFWNWFKNKNCFFRDPTNKISTEGSYHSI